EAPESKTPTEEVSEDKIKEMMQLVPVEDVYVQALQVKHSIIDWKALVKEYLSIRPASNDKEMELWVELKRMYEPDPEDQLWTLTQNYMHAPVEWKLYDLSGVHHFWSTARIETTDQETKIIATVDGKPRTISESSLRRHLKLNDEEGISSLPDDEPASLSRDDRQGEASPTVSILDAGQDRVNIAKTSAMPYESSPRVPSLDADKGSCEAPMVIPLGLLVHGVTTLAVVKITLTVGKLPISVGTPAVGKTSAVEKDAPPLDKIFAASIELSTFTISSVSLLP
nr:hypothetical protein [Tanacetum cinerariifolium]